ncbi:hypothetical protein RJT34_23106 [Clitoria ternatea]|uniref:Uncharacterized protein n=1 Tax=Clitoria ternatea TaxID=43366 RepID=A0AAN9FKC2_CLITE
MFSSKLKASFLEELNGSNSMNGDDFMKVDSCGVQSVIPSSGGKIELIGLNDIGAEWLGVSTGRGRHEVDGHRGKDVMMAHCEIMKLNSNDLDHVGQCEFVRSNLEGHMSHEHVMDCVGVEGNYRKIITCWKDSSQNGSVEDYVTTLCGWVCGGSVIDGESEDGVREAKNEAIKNVGNNGGEETKREGRGDLENGEDELGASRKGQEFMRGESDMEGVSVKQCVALLWHSRINTSVRVNFS